MALPAPTSPRRQKEGFRELQERCYRLWGYLRPRLRNLRKDLHMPRSLDGTRWRYLFVWIVKANISMMPGPQTPIRIIYFMLTLEVQVHRNFWPKPTLQKLCISIFPAEFPVIVLKRNSNSREIKTIVCCWSVVSSFFSLTSLRY